MRLNFPRNKKFNKMSRRRKRVFKPTGTAKLGRLSRKGAPFFRREARIARGRRATPTNQVFAKLKNKYVDGYLDAVLVHVLSPTADDTWADTELNPRQVTAIYGCLPVPRIGAGAFADRDDRRILTRKIMIKGFVRWPTSDGIVAATTIPYVRIIIIKDTRTNGSAMSAENAIGAGNGSDGAVVTSGDGGGINMFTNPNGWGRYEILRDIKILPPPVSPYHDGTDAASPAKYTPFKITVRPNEITNFSGTTGAVGSIIDNSYHLIAACNDAAAPLLCYYARTVFIDK